MAAKKLEADNFPYINAIVAQFIDLIAKESAGGERAYKTQVRVFTDEEREYLSQLRKDGLIEPKVHGSISMSEFNAQAERNRKLNAHKDIYGWTRVEGKVESRDLTDDELKTLRESYKKGREAMKTHPWNGNYDDHEYWKKGVKKIR